MNKRDYLWDAAGQLGQTLMTTLVGQLTYFYTEKIGLAAAAAASILAITKLISAAFDLFMGRIIETGRRTARGKFTPWLARMAVPAAAATVLLFLVPNITTGARLTYVFCTNLIFVILTTAISVPYASLQVVRTDKTEERSRIGIFRGVAAYAGGILITLAVIPLTNRMGGDQRAWVVFAVFTGLLGACALLLCWKHSRETKNETAPDAATQGKTRLVGQLRQLMNNRHWLKIFSVNILSQLIYGVNAVSTTYYCKWIFGNDNLMTVIGAFGVLGTVLGFVLIDPCVKRLGATKTMRLFLLLGGVASALRILAPYQLVWNTLLMSVANISMITLSCLMGVFTAMTVDYNEVLCGDKMIAFTQSVGSMGSKVGATIGGSLTGWVLGAVGYSSSMSALTATVSQGIFAISIYIPMAVYLIMYLIMLSFRLEKKGT